MSNNLEDILDHEPQKDKRPVLNRRVIISLSAIVGAGFLFRVTHLAYSDILLTIGASGLLGYVPFRVLFRQSRKREHILASALVILIFVAVMRSFYFEGMALMIGILITVLVAGFQWYQITRKGG